MHRSRPPGDADTPLTPWFLRGGGDAGATAREVDWTQTPLGAPEGWPPTLKSVVATMFSARQPMFLWWGDELTQIYNDGYLPSFGQGKHPAAMGQPGRDCWGEIWPIIWPQIEDVMERGISSWNEDQLVPIQRNGRLEEVYWTYGYSPVFHEDGRVAGTLVICTETTNRVLSARRNQVLHALTSAGSVARNLGALQQGCLHVLAEAAQDDLPCVVLCERDRQGRWGPVGCTGLSDQAAGRLCGHAASALDGEGDGECAIMLPERDVPLNPPHVDGAYLRSAYASAPLGGASNLRMLFGLSDQLPFDAAYRTFLEQVTNYVHGARTHLEETRRRAAIEKERRRLLEQAPVATALLVGPEHVFELANPCFCEMVGRNNLVGQRYADAFPELADTPLPAILDRVYTLGEPFATDEEQLPLDKGAGLGESFFQFNLEPVRDVRGQVYGMMAIAVEVTEQVKARRVLEQASEQREALLRELEQASRAKDEFLAMLGHELRNPLSPIVTALQLMREDAEGPVSHEHTVIERQVQHLVRLVDDLLDVAKIARGKVELQRERIDVHGVLHDAAETARPLIEQRKHTLEIECPRETLWCHADRGRLSQVVANLLTNAARYTDPGGQVRLLASREGDEVAIRVRDDGMGISAAMLPRVFDMFAQGQRSSDRAEGGLGIGLSLVQNLTALHGGRVSVHSDGLGCGSEFVVRLPLATATSAQPDQTGAATTPDATRQRRRVLIVDDNADAAGLLELTLSRAGHEAAVASDPLAALDLAARFEPDVAILDIGLPVMDGYELASRLRVLPRGASCHLFALTGYGQQSDRDRSRAAGFEHHLTKPVSVKQLLQLIDAAEPLPRQT